MSKVQNPFFKFTVQGRGQFPLDMLRYDSCYPVDTETATHMAASHNPYIRATVRTYFLRGQMRWGPTVDRWSSFGFRVTNSEQER